MKIYILSLLLLFVISCKTETVDSCLQKLEITSTDENGDIYYNVIGEIIDVSKGADDLELALSETLGLEKGVLNGCLVFKENFPECFGYFILDTRTGLDLSNIKFNQKVKVKVNRIEIDEPIEVSKRNQKNVEYLYLVMEVENI